MLGTDAETTWPALKDQGHHVPIDRFFVRNHTSTPVRVIVPHRIGIAPIKWVGRIEVSAEPLFSPWNTRFYRLFGRVKVKTTRSLAASAAA